MAKLKKSELTADEVAALEQLPLSLQEKLKVRPSHTNQLPHMRRLLSELKGGKEVTLDGVCYPSIGAAASALGVSYTSARNRVKRLEKEAELQKLYGVTDLADIELGTPSPSCGGPDND